MLYREIMAVCSEIHTKHINILCGQNVEMLNFLLEATKIRCRSLKAEISSLDACEVQLEDHFYSSMVEI